MENCDKVMNRKLKCGFQIFLNVVWGLLLRAGLLWDVGVTPGAQGQVVLGMELGPSTCKSHALPFEHSPQLGI